MSHSPLTEAGPREAAQYLEAIDQWGRLVQAGSSHSGRERNCAYLNLDGERFVSISAVSGLDFPDDARGVAAVDWDHDGDLDLWLTNRTGPQLRLMRNDGAGGQRSLALNLVGRTVNRDAIGARVELHSENGGPVRVRHVTAGSGFLSQGSKWLHFGLGESPSIDRLVVHWPDGETQTFQDLEPWRYRLVQGASKVSVAREREPVELSAAASSVPEPTGAAVVRLASRPPAPAMRYSDWEGEVQEVDVTSGRPRLVNLWASWCAPCAAELADLTHARKALKQGGVDVIALSVDGLGDERGAEPAALQEYLGQLDFAFASGQASAELMDKLELLFTRMFGRHVSFPVPTSLLFDAEGRLATIWFGRVEVAAVLAEVETLDGDPESLRAAATPFTGRWLSEPRPADLSLLAREYLRAGYAEDAEPLLRLELPAGKSESRQLLATALSVMDRVDEAESFYRQAIALEPTSVRARYNYARLLAAADRDAEAVEQLGQVLAFEPAHSQARLAMANALVRSGRSVEALEHYRAALQQRPRWAVAWNALIRQLAAGADERVRNVPAAVQLAERIVRESQSRVPEFLDSLAIAYAAAGRFEEAVAAERRAKELAEEDGRDEYVAEIDGRIERFEDRRTWVEPH